MGGGGNRSLTGDDQCGQRAPHEKPPFTVGQLKKAIPAHCFKKSLRKSFSSLTVNLVGVGAVLYASTFITCTGPLGWILWSLYGIAQGCVIAGLWVLAHECGHNAFSNYPLLDDMVGLLLHTCLFVPYFSWRISHRRHHSNTGNLTKEEVFTPKTRDFWGARSELWNSPPGRLIDMVSTLTVGWPLYLLFNVRGRSYDRFASHFDPNSPIFNSREKLQVLISNGLMLTMIVVLHRMALDYGLEWVLKVYWVPIVVVNGILILVTFLNHTHPSLPRYADTEWDWLRGALTTVDRDYGFMNHVLHRAGDTHVVHHIFPSIPHYHALEATAAIRPILGEYYQYDDTPIAKALWREFNRCIFVAADSPQEEGNGVLWFRNKSNFD